MNHPIYCGECGKEFQLRDSAPVPEEIGCPYCGYKSDPCDFPDVQKPERPVDDGGPAFPVLCAEASSHIERGGCDGFHPIQDGMSLRAYLASDALKAILTHHGMKDHRSMKMDVHTAIMYADEMIRQLREAK